MKRNLVITSDKDKIYYGYFADGKPVELYCSKREAGVLLGNIYLGRVERVAEGIHGAFVALGSEGKCFYRLTQTSRPYKLTPGHEDKLYGGDLILLQISKDSMGEKLPVATDNITIHGNWFVLTLSDPRISVSRKIRDKQEINRLKTLMQKKRGEGIFGLLARTNAGQVKEADLSRELDVLIETFHTILKRAKHAAGAQLLYREPAHYLTLCRELPAAQLDEIVTDDPRIYQELTQMMAPDFYQNLREKIRRYKDPYSLYQLYRFSHCYQIALSKKVMLPSGGYLYIEATQAMTVIDVNSGAVIKNKSREEDLYWRINQEAAGVIACHLRLRNISGIVVIDFINMKSRQKDRELLEYLQNCCSRDRRKVKVMDTTALGLVELTRARVLLPLAAQWKETES